ncbi:MAG TPA: type II CAAX endopeptidase family protein [Terriglobia bacterium]|nr:type II CAAX endopeptidase family protein [Terriglobia bacterium]
MNPLGPAMRKALLAGGSLVLLASGAEALVWLRYPYDPLKLASFFLCFALVLGAFAALTDSKVVRQLREWAVASPAAALGLPFLLLLPYFIFAFGTGTFSATGAGKLTAYIAAPVLLLAPDRLREATQAGWRDFAAMLALGVPVAAHLLNGIWMWPEDLYFFRPLYSVCVGAYAFLVIRNLEGIGYNLTVGLKDTLQAVIHFAGFAILCIPLGIALGFLHPHAGPVSPWAVGFQFIGIYLTIAIPEELLFRGILQNFLVKSFRSARRELYGLLAASVIFGAAHLHHAPVPNWRYMILATLAGVFYGNVYRTRRSVSASAITHTLVDTAWRFWF